MPETAGELLDPNGIADEDKPDEMADKSSVLQARNSWPIPGSNGRCHIW